MYNSYEEDLKKIRSSLKHLYNRYIYRVEQDNLARDMYDGDTYMGYEDEMTFNEWLSYEFEEDK